MLNPRLIIAVGLAVMSQCTDAGCPSLFTNYNMGCYYVGQTPVGSAKEAFETCYQLGGYLLNMNAELENNYTMDAISKQQTIFDGYWVGGYYNGEYWMWQSIAPETGREVNEFMNPAAEHYQWGPLQPDDGLVPMYAEYNVAIMVRGRPVPYKWYSENGGLATFNGMGYICEANWKE